MINGSDEESPPDPFSDPDAQTVLVVDDLADMRRLACRCLREHGYRTRTAVNGVEALNSIRSDPPDLVISDWMMPQMTGPELVEAIRGDESIEGIPIVLLTAKSDEASRVTGTQVGADVFLAKPFDDLELSSIVRNLLRLKRKEREEQDQGDNEEQAQ